MGTDTLEILKIVGSIACGGAGLELVKRAIGTNKVGELSGIIEVMGKRIDKQDAKILELETKVEHASSENLTVTETLNKYKYAATFLAMCDKQHICPMKEAFEKMKNTEK